MNDDKMKAPVPGAAPPAPSAASPAPATPGQQPGGEAEEKDVSQKKPEELTPEDLRLMADTMPGEGPGDD